MAKGERKATRVSLVAQLVKNPPATQETLVQFLGQSRKMPWRLERLPTPVFVGFSSGSDSKESTCNVGDLGLRPELGRSPGERKWGTSSFPFKSKRYKMACITFAYSQLVIWPLKLGKAGKDNLFLFLHSLSLLEKIFYLILEYS